MGSCIKLNMNGIDGGISARKMEGKEKDCSETGEGKVEKIGGYHKSSLSLRRRRISDDWRYRETEDIGESG